MPKKKRCWSTIGGIDERSIRPMPSTSAISHMDTITNVCVDNIHARRQNLNSRHLGGKYGS